MVEQDLPFGRRSAQMLMKVAQSPVLANTKHASLLPASWYTLYELSRLPAAQAETDPHWPERRGLRLPARVVVLCAPESLALVNHLETQLVPTRQDLATAPDDFEASARSVPPVLNLDDLSLGEPHL